jgi:2-polyprenyl-3-methyl-5-hydroxy-6-metoxy-1,4-benzoquinol methylase
MASPDDRNLNREVHEAWNANAGWWDDYVGPEGNDFHRILIAPAQVELLALKPGERVLDIAYGNGQFARQMAGLGVEVLACDFCEPFLERARRHTAQAGIRSIEYRTIDATSAEELLALGERTFDAAVCTMALMDMATIEPLFASLAQLLKPGGRFVFSVTHPCFQNASCQMVAETEDREGDFRTVFSVKVREYLHQEARRGIGIVGQPEPHLYFDRPLSELFASGFRAGFVLDGLREPALAGELEPARLASWSNYSQIPPVLVARMRLPA